MKVAFFSSRSYDKARFNKLTLNFKHQLTYFEVKLDQDTGYLAQGFNTICTFVNDHLDQNILKKQAE